MHEKNVRHGHISTLHIWPARRPLAASRAALIATLLPDPGTPEKRSELIERIGGHVVKVLKKKQGPGGGEEKVVEETVGGILHWGRETENKAALDSLREEIRKAYGGRAPRILDPFAGGGAIPLEAMRLGCDVTAVDINPVAWFILKCTLEYSQTLAGEKRPLPEFVRADRAFMEAFFKAQGMKGAMLRTQLKKLGLEGDAPNTDGAQQPSLNLEIEGHTLDADLAWHVRAWGWWVLREARRELVRYYPVYADWQPLKDVADWRKKHPDQVRPIQHVPLREDGTVDSHGLNAALSTEQLADARQPRWAVKPPVAYLTCSPYVNAASSLWVTGKLDTQEFDNGSLPASSPYFLRNLSGQNIVSGLVDLGAVEDTHAFVGNKGRGGFASGFNQLNLAKDSFVVLIKSPTWESAPTHVAFAYWQPVGQTGDGRWMVSEANQRAGRVTNRTLEQFSASLGRDAMIEVRSLRR